MLTLDLSLFQKPPVGNGRCDPDFDIPIYDWDGGDCCESTCISGDVYHCGKDESGLIDVYVSFEFRVKFMIHISDFALDR